MRKTERRCCLDPLAVVVLAVLLLSTTWCIRHLGVSCADRNSSRTGAIAHNSNQGNSSSNSSSLTVLLPHHCSRQTSGHHSSFPPVTFPATSTGRWGTLLKSAVSPSKATHRELWHPWSINRGANRRVLCHGLAVPTISPWRRFPQKNITAGMFFLNKHPIIILFGSGASHDFMSSNCAKKVKLSLVASRAPYVISTLRGRVDADQIVQKVPLELSGRIFNTNLIILSGQGIDVILGMRWMKLHRVVLDIAGRSVHSDSPVCGTVILHLPVISRIKASLYHVV
jgi:hypothetical protein